MLLKSITIHGLRGFGITQTLELGIPNNKPGSGLTVIVGPNNSGKSTIIEAFRAISQNGTPSFTEGRRNKRMGDRVSIKIESLEGNWLELKTIESGGSETTFIENGISENQVKAFVLQSRRAFAPFFGKGLWTRETYIQNNRLPPIRNSQLDHFSYRLFQIQNNQRRFNQILNKILNPIPQWYIDQADNGQYYLKFNFGDSFHNSDGAGEGLLSIFTIVDALYDSQDNDVIVIDEPELSLHPSLQRKLMSLFLEFSSNRQIILSTHSPYFINWLSLVNGGKIARTVKNAEGDIVINQPKVSTINEIKGLLDNLNNPHIFGLDASEIFFLEDRVILVEGQEDVIFYKRILELLDQTLNGSFYGWGIGGAPNMRKILNLLVDLGYKKVVGILDNNMEQLKKELEREYERYKFILLPTEDIRNKKEVKAKPPKEGLIDYAGNKIKDQYKEDILKINREINEYLNSV